MSRNALASSGVASAVRRRARAGHGPQGPKSDDGGSGGNQLFHAHILRLRRRQQRLGRIRQKLIQVAVRDRQQRAVRWPDSSPGGDAESFPVQGTCGSSAPTASPHNPGKSTSRDTSARVMSRASSAASTANGCAEGGVHAAGGCGVAVGQDAGELDGVLHIPRHRPRIGAEAGHGRLQSRRPRRRRVLAAVAARSASHRLRRADRHATDR